MKYTKLNIDGGVLHETEKENHFGRITESVPIASNNIIRNRKRDHIKVDNLF